MALYFYFNETTGDLVYSDKGTYSGSGYTSLGQQTNMNPTSNSRWVFHSKRSSIKSVSKDPTIDGKIPGLKSMYYMFYSCSSLTSLDLSNFDTSQVTRMSSMFRNCSGLTSLDLSGFDTSQVTDTDSMFYGCSSLTSVDLSGFDTSKVTEMGSMFYNCSSLTSLDLSGFDTSQVTDMSGMFERCSGLTSFDLSGFDTSKVTWMTNMFFSCSNLRLIATSDTMSNVLSRLPASQYYPASGGSPVAKADLTAGTWVRDEEDLSLLSTITEQAQMIMSLRRQLTGLVQRITNLETQASNL